MFAGGKRIRPGILFAAGRTFGADEKLLVRTAAAIEMIHTFSLIHDDLPAMDDDDLRRGRETCHKKFDEATAILAGDALLAMAFEVVAGDENLSPELRLKLVSQIANASGTPMGMVAGQQRDPEAQGQRITIHEKAIGRTFGANALPKTKSNQWIGSRHGAKHSGLIPGPIGKAIL